MAAGTPACDVDTCCDQMVCSDLFETAPNGVCGAFLGLKNSLKKGDELCPAATGCTSDLCCEHILCGRHACDTQNMQRDPAKHKTACPLTGCTDAFCCKSTGTPPPVVPVSMVPLGAAIKQGKTVSAGAAIAVQRKTTTKKSSKRIDMPTERVAISKSGGTTQAAQRFRRAASAESLLREAEGDVQNLVVAKASSKMATTASIDGTVSREAAQRFRVTSAESLLREAESDVQNVMKMNRVIRAFKNPGVISAQCANPKPQEALFANVWTEPEWKLAEGLLTRLNAVAKHVSTEGPFLFYGTLLGQKRHGGVIPWDDDMDVAISRSSWDLMAPTLREKHPSNIGAVAHAGYHKLFYTNRPMIKKYPWSWPFVDVFLADRPKGATGGNGGNVTIQIGREGTDVESYESASVFPLASCQFGGISMMCPSQAKKVLDASYPNWDTMCDSGGYRHVTEEAREERQKNIPCKCLKKTTSRLSSK